MSVPRTIALLAPNPAFAGIVGRALELDGRFRVVSFSGIQALSTYLQIASTELLILDADMPGAPAADIARGLRRHVRLASPDLRMIALTRAGSPARDNLLAAGIGAVLEKPVDPVALRAAVERLLGIGAPRPALSRQALETLAGNDNVVTLFGPGHVRVHH